MFDADDDSQSPSSRLLIYTISSISLFFTSQIYANFSLNNTAVPPPPFSTVHISHPRALTTAVPLCDARTSLARLPNHTPNHQSWLSHTAPKIGCGGGFADHANLGAPPPCPHDYVS
jgi:hypothetical protein